MNSFISSEANRLNLRNNIIHFSQEKNNNPAPVFMKVAIVANNKHRSSDNSAANESNGNATAVRGKRGHKTTAGN